MTLRGPLHDRGANGRCEACGEPFPCPTGLAIYDMVKRELEHPSPPPAAAPAQRHLEPAEPFESVANLGVSFGWGSLLPVRWENLEDREARCPHCLHWWVSHGVPTEDGYGCSIPTSSMAERGLTSATAIAHAAAQQTGRCRGCACTARSVCTRTAAARRRGRVCRRAAPRQFLPRQARESRNRGG
jgi:hypothetical protein